jgi:hypothetical protein
MKSHAFFQNIALLAFAAIVISSCRPDKDLDSDTNAAKNESQIERFSNELNDIADQAIRTGDLSGYKISSEASSFFNTCAVVTIDTVAEPSASNPNSMTIDFGTGCTGNDGKIRTGIVRVTFTGRYRDEGTIITITPESYTVNGNQLSGSRVVTNIGNNANGQPQFNIVVNATLVLANGEGSISWNSTRTRTWLSGFNTPFLFLDDEYGITGSANGTSPNGNTWSSQINQQLVYKVSCRQFVSGSLSITPQNRPVRTLDYGSGQCDNTATVTINGNSYTIIIQ